MSKIEYNITAEQDRVNYEEAKLAIEGTPKIYRGMDQLAVEFRTQLRLERELKRGNCPRMGVV